MFNIETKKIEIKIEHDTKSERIVYIQWNKDSNVYNRYIN